MKAGSIYDRLARATREDAVAAASGLIELPPCTTPNYRSSGSCRQACVEVPA